MNPNSFIEFQHPINPVVVWLQHSPTSSGIDPALRIVYRIRFKADEIIDGKEFVCNGPMKAMRKMQELIEELQLDGYSKTKKD